MFPLSKRAKSLKPSPTLQLASKAKELQAAGHNVISLSVGEPDWDTLQCAKRAGIKAIEEGFSKYQPSNGTPQLRKVITNKTKSEIGVEYSPDDVTVSTGGKFIIFSALQALIDSGDEVIIPAPYWVSYPSMVELSDGKPVIALCDESVDFKLTAEILEKHISPKTKLLILNSPSNPTGLMYSKKELESLAEVLRRHPQVFVMSDDIYNRLVFEAAVAPHLLQVAPDLKGRVLVVNGAAKTYAMTGWRVGWALGPEPWIKAMTNYQSQSVSCAASMAQKATESALTEGEPELIEKLKELKRRRDFVVELFKSIPGFELRAPDGAFYIWPNIKACLGKTYKGKKLVTSADFSNALLEAEKVVVVPGVEFGLDGYLRISYALNDKAMQDAAQRIRTFVASL